MFQKLTVEGKKLVLGMGALVGLDEAQRKVRAHNLKATPTEGVYEILQPMEFKVGEVIEVDPTGLSRAAMESFGEKDADGPSARAGKKGKSGGNRSA